VKSSSKYVLNYQSILIRIRIMAEDSDCQSVHVYPGPVPEIPLISQLQECTSSLSTTAAKVEKILMDMVDRKVNKSKRAESEEGFDEFGETRELLDALRQSRDIWLKTMINIKANTSVFDNFTTGKAVQKLYSATRQPINGRNRAYGPMAFQAGGFVSDATAQKISGDMAHINGYWSNNGESAPLPSTTPSLAERTMERTDNSESKGKLDSGLGQTPEPVDDTAASTAGAKEGRTRSSRKK
jgi:hypothetical protein